MKYFKIYILIFFLFFFLNLTGQDNNTPEDEEGMNLFLLFLVMGAMALMFGAAFVGALVAGLIMFSIIILTALGIISISFLAGLQKRSVTAGFKTFTYISSCIVGAVTGIAGVWVLFRLLNLDVNSQTTIITGIVSGFTGGLILAYFINKLFPLVLLKIRERYFSS